MHQSLHAGREAKQEHVRSEPYVRLEPLQENIGRDLRKHIRYEEDDQGRIVFDIAQIEVLRKIEDIRVRDVDAVQKSEEIQDTQEWEDPPVYPCYNLALGRMRWTLNMEVLIVFASCFVRLFAAIRRSRVVLRVLAIVE